MPGSPRGREIAHSFAASHRHPCGDLGSWKCYAIRQNQINETHMQGEKIIEETGQVTSQRVLPNPGGGPKMETSFRANGKLLGVEATDTGTYWSMVRPDGSLFG